MKNSQRNNELITEYKAYIEKDRQTSNPMTSSKTSSSRVLSGYTQTVQRSNYDKDIADVVEIVRILNNMAPTHMPVYNFDFSEINGEYFYKPDGSFLLAREYDGDIIRDYYASKTHQGKVDRILEHDRNSGRLRSKIEPVSRAGSRINTNITIFDVKLNNKYTIIQLAEDGIVNNITEFTGRGKSFQSLYRNIETLKPVRYLEGRETPDEPFEMIDCIFDPAGNVARIKRYTNKKEVCIDYKDGQKQISVKNK